MDVTDLKVVDAVARHGSMNKAASELNTVQSNVSARIRSLEDELGVSLFQRSARGVQVTPAGRRILPFAARLSRLLSDASCAARDDGHPKGVFEIGTLETTLASLGILAPEPLEFGSIEAIIACVSAGVGVTLLPRGVVASALSEGLVNVHELAPEIANVETVFVRRIDAYFSSALSTFLDSVRLDRVTALTPR
jgi:DNA-binding transcriptional LysR family regulator